MRSYERGYPALLDIARDSPWAPSSLPRTPSRDLWRAELAGEMYDKLKGVLRAFPITPSTSRSSWLRLDANKRVGFCKFNRFHAGRRYPFEHVFLQGGRTSMDRDRRVFLQDLRALGSLHLPMQRFGATSLLLRKPGRDMNSPR